ncbi:hypothetical protein ACLOJK_040958, partial [Asimina triloba]
MADALLSIALEKLNRVLGKQISLFAGATHELEKLRDTFQSIQALLADAESKQAADENVNLWLSRLRGVAYDINDLLDEWWMMLSSSSDAGPSVSMPADHSREHYLAEAVPRTSGLERIYEPFSNAFLYRDEMAPGHPFHAPIGTQAALRGSILKPELKIISSTSSNTEPLPNKEVVTVKQGIFLHQEEAEHDDDDRNKVRACLLSPCTALDHVASRYMIARRITEIRERLDQIDGEKNKYCFSSSSGGGGRQLVSSRPHMGSLTAEEMMGRDQDKAEIINRLICGSSTEDELVHVIAIVGIGGQGKTTLAREIYNDRSLPAHFNLFSWVCVTEIFDVARVTKAILDDLKVKTETHEQSPLQKELRGKLDGKRFLIILDDVWNEDEERWNELRASLTSGAAGSRILVTTRTRKVANTMNAVYVRELQGLLEDDSWRLFSSRAFAGRNDRDHSDLQATGRQIVSNCKGVPLSIKVMGSAMNSKRTVEDWQNILESKMWSLPEAKSKILPALWLSYYNLPPPLKPCFAYCSIYEKDTEMEKDKLVNLWVAQGFVHAQGNREIEDIAAEHFDDLVACSMFQEASSDGSRCKMHDLLHDLAELITKDETYVDKSEKSHQCHTNVRHASFHVNGKSSVKMLRSLFLHEVDKIDTGLDNLFRQARFLRALVFRDAEIKTLPSTIGKLKHLRYLDLSRSWIVELPNVIGKMKYLKYLDLSNSKLLELPNAIGKLKHLTYLDLSWSKIVELPESVRHLHNLRTLNLSYCSKLKKLPSGMGGMVGLRYLEIEGTPSLEYLPKGMGGMGGMTGLKSLSKFIVGGEGGCEINELRQLNCLQGSLEIKHLERVSNREEAEKAELRIKRHLYKLVLEMSSDRGEESSDSGEESSDRGEGVGSDDAETERMDSVLEGLRPHANLEELRLECGRHNSKLPSWMADLSLSKLTRLEIRGSVIQREQNNLPGLGQLPALKHLQIENVGLKKVGRELYYGNLSNDVVGGGGREAFAKLEELVLQEMSELEEWELMSEFDADVRIMPSLSILRINYCPKLVGLPDHFANAPLTKLVIRGCHRLKWRGCSSSFSHLEEFTLDDSSEFLSNGLPHLPNLKEFRISEIRNEALPNGGWEQLVALRQLEIYACCELKSLPDGLTQLQSLENLKIDGCHEVPLLPEGLGQLKKLQSLSIRHLEVLTCLPDSLGRLESLKRLEILDSKNLQSLPEGLGELKKLKSLEISNAEALICLPNSLAQLESLEQLHISGLKKLELLPEGLERLKKLKSLKIRGVEVLTFPPNSLGQLESLEELEMDCLKKFELPLEGLGQLKKLELLKIGGDEELTCLPDSLGQLESLEYFTVIGLAKLESLPHSLVQLKKLRRLEIENMEALINLPESLGQLESLKGLTISHCGKLKSLPHSFGQLESLQIDHLQALTCLPNELAQLKSLKYLYIGGWKELESLPHWLGQLKALRSLIISDCTAL